MARVRQKNLNTHIPNLHHSTNLSSMPHTILVRPPGAGGATGRVRRRYAIHQGKAKGHIATREFQHHDPSSLYACQDAARYDWFFEEGVGDVVDNGDDVIGDDNDGGDVANFDEVCDVADMLNDIRGLGEDSDNESDNDDMMWGEA
jgi:hypothetical protein